MKTEEGIDIQSVMQKCIMAYKYIEKYDNLLQDICIKKIKPLLDCKKYNEAKKRSYGFLHAKQV